MHREYDKLQDALKNNPPPPPSHSDNHPILFSAVPDYLAQPNTTSSTYSVDCRPRLASIQYHDHLVAQPSQSVPLTNKPCPDGPICVGPATAATAAPTSTTNIDKFNHSISLPRPILNTTGEISISGVNNSNSSVQQVVLSNQYQYQDCTVGFCGRWGSYAHTIQVSSQPHIQTHPSPMLGTQ